MKSTQKPSNRTSNVSSSRNSSRGSSRYSSPARYTSPSRPHSSITFSDLASKAINDLLKIRAQKISKCIEITAKELSLHKKLRTVIFEEIKSKFTKNPKISLQRVDERVNFIMKESASELLELENRCKSIQKQNNELKEEIKKIRGKSSIFEVIDGIAVEGKKIEACKDIYYMDKLQNTAKGVLEEFAGLEFKEIASVIAWNIQQEREIMETVRKDNYSMIQYEVNIRKRLESKIHQLENNT